MRRGIFVTLMFLGIIPWMTGCQSARQIAMPGDGAATGSVTLKGQILQWVNEGGQSLVPSGSVTVRETQAQSSIHPDGSFRVPLPQPGTFHFVFRHSQGSEAEVEVQVEDTGEVEVRIVIQGRVGNLVEKIHINPAGKADLMGRVANPNAGPNQFTLQVFDQIYTIQYDNSTNWINTSPARLKSGDPLEVKGQYNGNFTVLARKVRLHAPQGPKAEFEAKGTVSNAAVTCSPTPSGSFVLNHPGGLTTILVDAQTRFKKGTCENLRVGAFVEVKSRRPASTPAGAWIADEVKFEKQEAEFEAKGTVTNLSGNPCGGSASFVLQPQGVTILVDAQTRFQRGSCANLVDGVRVEVKSRRPSGNAWIADKIEFEH
jgi:hypothetical protein